MAKRALVRIDPTLLRDHVFGREKHAVTSAQIVGASVDPDTGVVVLELLGESVPSGKCTAVFKSVEAAGGVKAAVFQGLLPD